MRIKYPVSAGLLAALIVAISILTTVWSAGHLAGLVAVFAGLVLLRWVAHREARALS